MNDRIDELVKELSNEIEKFKSQNDIIRNKTEDFFTKEAAPTVRLVSEMNSRKIELVQKFVYEYWMY